VAVVPHRRKEIPIGTTRSIIRQPALPQQISLSEPHVVEK
jgi:hypothetical protein